MRDDRVDRRVHRADDVGGGSRSRPFGAERALVLQGPCRVVAAQPAGGGVVVRAVAALVAQRPDDDARMVLVAARHPRHPFQEGGAVAGFVGDLVVVAVALDVGLVHHVQAEFVGEVEQRGIVGVVGGADGVEAEALDDGQVGAQVGLVEDPAGERVEVVPVDSPDEHPLAVDQQVAAADLDGAETDTAAGLVGDRAVGVVEPYRQLVQLGCLGRPGADLGDRRGQGGPALPRGALVGRDGLPGERLVQALQLSGDVPARGEETAGVPWVGLDPQPPGAALGQVRRHAEVGEVQRVGGVQEHRAGDAAVPPVVLVLDIGRVRPFDDREPHGVGLPGAHGTGDVELARQMCVLARPDGLPVDVGDQRALGGTHVQDDPPSRPVRRDVDLALMHSGGVDGRQVGRRLGPGHAVVGVLRQVADAVEVVEVLHGPASRHLQVRPVAVRLGVGARQQLEAPAAVEVEAVAGRRGERRAGAAAASR
ncbi:hypothetical protein SALBM311S_12461 [Streptomyces alboniger]